MELISPLGVRFRTSQARGEQLLKEPGYRPLVEATEVASPAPKKRTPRKRSTDN